MVGPCNSCSIATGRVDVSTSYRVARPLLMFVAITVGVPTGGAAGLYVV